MQLELTTQMLVAEGVENARIIGSQPSHLQRRMVAANELRGTGTFFDVPNIPNPATVTLTSTSNNRILQTAEGWFVLSIYSVGRDGGTSLKVTLTLRSELSSVVRTRSKSLRAQTPRVPLGKR